jgi:hypothetical protein
VAENSVERGSELRFHAGCRWNRGAGWLCGIGVIGSRPPVEGSTSIAIGWCGGFGGGGIGGLEG